MKTRIILLSWSYVENDGFMWLNNRIYTQWERIEDERRDRTLSQNTHSNDQ